MVNKTETLIFTENFQIYLFFNFMIGMYSYAVENYQISSITYTYLIRGLTQNEGDAVHSDIEKIKTKLLNLASYTFPNNTYF